MQFKSTIRALSRQSTTFYGKDSVPKHTKHSLNFFFLAYYSKLVFTVQYYILFN